MSVQYGHSIADRLGEGHALLKFGLHAPKKTEKSEAEELIESAQSRFEWTPPPVFGVSLRLMTDNELACLARGGSLAAVEALILRYGPYVERIARRGAARYRLDADDCAVIAKIALFRTATLLWRPPRQFKNYAVRMMVGAIGNEAKQYGRARGYRVIGGRLTKLATVVEDTIVAKSGDEIAHSDFAEEKEKKTEQILEIVAAEQQADQSVSAWQLVKDGDKLAAFLKALPPFASEEARRMMRGLTVEESMAETGALRQKITKARGVADRMADEWGLA